MPITQETFDEVVNENMEEFGMGRKEAVEEATKQLASQGADLSLVDSSGDGVRRNARADVHGHIDSLRNLDLNKDYREPSLMALSELGRMCQQEGDVGQFSRNAVGEVNGMNELARFLAGACRQGGVIHACLLAICGACRSHQGNRDAFTQENMANLNARLVAWMNVDNCGGIVGDSTDGSDIAGAEGCEEEGAVVAAGLRVARLVCTKNENSKGHFMRQEGIAVLTGALRRYGQGNGKDPLVTREACGALRAVTLADDHRKDFSGTYDNVKVLSKAGTVSLLLSAASAFANDSTTIANVYLALKQLAANDENVKEIVHNGGLELVSNAVASFPLDAVLCRAALALFRNICANDQLKTRLVNEDGLRIVLGCMAQHEEDRALQEHGCATMAAMSLRSPSNAVRIVAENGIATTVEAMRRHRDAVGLQRQACLCIRNIAARGPSLRPVMIDEGCETALREAGKLKGCVDEAYGALRDLHCEVNLVTMTGDGTVRVGVKAFGDETANFNPSAQQTSDLCKRIDGASSAPKRSGFMM